MKTVAVITSRWESKRLKGKALAMIGDKPMLQHVVDNARKAQYVDEVVVATTENSQPIIDYCLKNNIPYYAHWNEWDVLSRLYEVAKWKEAGIIVYLWGDTPLIKSSDIDTAISQFKWYYSSYLTLNTKRGIIAVTSSNQLFLEYNGVLFPKEREYIHDKLRQAEGSVLLHGDTLPLSVDTQEDLDKVREIYALL